MIIDDLLKTGTALNTLLRFLKHLGADELHAFVFIHGRFHDPSRERSLVSGVIDQMTLAEILTILSHPRHRVTSATMLKYLESRTTDELLQIRRVISSDQVDRLRRNIRQYYRQHTLPSTLEQF